MSRASGPPPEERIRRREARQAGAGTRDMTPAVGRRGEPGSWRRAVEGAAVALLRPGFEDARWSFLYRGDTRYSARDTGEDGVSTPDSGVKTPRAPARRARGGEDDPVKVLHARARRAAARRARGGEDVPVKVQGPVIHAAVWTWEVPLYFWLGGIASGASFVALGADAAGDERAARVARIVALGAIAPGAPLLVLDLGRPERFLNMLRIFKLRSPMSTGAWCLTAFSAVMGTAVAADVLGKPRVARRLGAAGAALATYLGSYTGILLASTAVPVWARSRTFLPATFVCTAAANGAAATQLALAACGASQPGAPTRAALGAIETAAMAAELALSELNERRLGPLGEALRAGRPGRLFATARAAALGCLALRAAGRRGGPRAPHVASALCLLAGLAYRFAWVGAGRTSASDDEAVARAARRPPGTP